MLDGHGSVTSVTNDLGMVKDVFQYTPYGQVTLGIKEHESFYAYSGENFNPNTGLEYLRSRYYNTAMGRFQTEDTYLGNLTNPLTLNRYSYVMNNPINYIDPSGHMAAKQFTNTVLGSNAAAVVTPNLKKSSKKVDNSIKESPNYPEDFIKVQNGTKKVTVKNEFLLEELRKIEPGEWKKIYQNGYSNGNEVSIHYFQHTKTGKV